MPARGILTTDSGPKEVLVEYPDFTVAGMAKGAGMLAPDMATMLAFLTTDAAVSPAPLADILRAAVADSFNSMSVDGCTSTNDTVVLLASGRAGRGTRRWWPTRWPRRAPGWPHRWRPTPRAPTPSSTSR